MVIKQMTSNHCLHLCNNHNMEEIVLSYLVDADVFVTNNVEIWEKKLKKYEVKCQINKPEEIGENMKIVVDGASIGSEFKIWEKKWEKQNTVVCIYNIDKIEPSILKDLVNIHSKMSLSTNNIRMFSNKTLEKEIDNLSPNVVEDLVKKELKNIILSLLLSRSMCGTDLVKTIYTKFKVFISPGTLYPVLYELEKNGLLKYEHKLKNKIYSIQEREQAQLLLERHIKINSLLSKFLVSKNGN